MLLRWLRLKGFQSEIVDDTIIGINDGHRNIVLSAIPERRSVAFCEILELEEDADVQIAQKAADKLNDDFLSRKFDVNQDQRNLFIVFDCYMANPI